MGRAGATSNHLVAFTAGTTKTEKAAPRRQAQVPLPEPAIAGRGGHDVCPTQPKGSDDGGDGSDDDQPGLQQLLQKPPGPRAMGETVNPHTQQQRSDTAQARRDLFVLVPVVDHDTLEKMKRI